MVTHGAEIRCGACGRVSLYGSWHDYACPKCGAFAHGLWVREALDPKAAAALDLEQIATQYELLGQADMAARVRARIKVGAA